MAYFQKTPQQRRQRTQQMFDTGTAPVQQPGGGFNPQPLPTTFNEGTAPLQQPGPMPNLLPPDGGQGGAPLGQPMPGQVMPPRTPGGAPQFLGGPAMGRPNAFGVSQAAGQSDHPFLDSLPPLQQQHLRQALSRGYSFDEAYRRMMGGR